MGAILAFFRGRSPETPIKGVVPRVKNILKNNFRGIFGVLIPVCIISWQLKLKDAPTTALHLWILMACFFLLQPVSVQVTGSIPIFAYPMLNILSTGDVVKFYFNEGIALFIIGGMLHLLLNNSGLDRRIAMFILCRGPAKNFTPTMLLIKGSLTGFFLSIFCHRLIVASTVIQYVTPILMDMQKATSRYRASEPNFDNVRYIVCNGIQTSCSIGGIAIVHASYCTLAFRAIMLNTYAYPDFLNYAQYTGFALPLAIGIFLVNLVYHALALKFMGGKPISDGRSAEIRTAMLKYKSEIPAKITKHEILTLIFLLLALATYFGRYIHSMQSGWTKLITQSNDVRDATVAAFFVIILHILPRSVNFIKIFKAKKKSDLPPIKPESAILFWRFVDKNTNYGYFLLIGAGLAIWQSTDIGAGDDVKKLNAVFASKLKFITDLPFCIALMVICFITVALANIMTGVAAVSIWLPVVLCLPTGLPDDSVWHKQLYRAALCVGIGSSFGYISPFLYTPAYFCYHTGKVPRLQMLKYSLIPCIISALFLYLATCYYAPTMFGADVAPGAKVGMTTTTAAPGSGGAPPAPPGPSD